MVYPTTDYYIVATKDGYDKYTSPTISVEQQIVKYDFKMSEINTTKGSDGDIYDICTTPPTDYGSIGSIILKDKTTLFKIIANMNNYSYEVSGNLYKLSDVNDEFNENQSFTPVQLQADVKSKFTPVEAIP
jgi:hypothetical protein